MKKDLRRYFINNRKKIPKTDKKNWDEKIKNKLISSDYYKILRRSQACIYFCQKKDLGLL